VSRRERDAAGDDEPAEACGDERPQRPAATWTPVLGDARRGHASISRSPVPAAQLRELAVLRRRPTAADRSPVVRSLLRKRGIEPYLLSVRGTGTLEPLKEGEAPDDLSLNRCVTVTVVNTSE